MCFMFATEVAADPVGHFLSREQTGGLDNMPFAVGPMRLNRIEPRTLGRQLTSDDTHALACLPYLSVIALIQLRTSLLMCQEALSQTMSNACLPTLANRSQHQVRYCVVMPLIGRPFTKRSQICCGKVSGAAGQDSNKP